MRKGPADVSTASSQSPEDPEIAFNLGAVLEATEQLQDAIAAYQRAYDGGIEVCVTRALSDDSVRSRISATAWRSTLPRGSEQKARALRTSSVRRRGNGRARSQKNVRSLLLNRYRAQRYRMQMPCGYFASGRRAQRVVSRRSCVQCRRDSACGVQRAASFCILVIAKFYHCETQKRCIATREQQRSLRVCGASRQSRCGALVMIVPNAPNIDNAPPQLTLYQAYTCFSRTAREPRRAIRLTSSSKRACSASTMVGFTRRCVSSRSMMTHGMPSSMTRISCFTAGSLFVRIANSSAVPGEQRPRVRPHSGRRKIRGPSHY